MITNIWPLLVTIIAILSLKIIVAWNRNVVAVIRHHPYTAPKLYVNYTDMSPIRTVVRSWLGRATINTCIAIHKMIPNCAFIPLPRGNWSTIIHNRRRCRRCHIPQHETNHQHRCHITPMYAPSNICAVIRIKTY